MVQNVGYWYFSQVRTILLHTQRFFSNFYISNGTDENGEEKLQRVPCVFMSTDKSALAMINNNTDTVLESAPKMVLTIAELKLNNEKMSGSPYYEYVSDVTEKYFDISFSESMLGYPLPDSHLEMAVLDTNNASANSS